MKKRGRPKNVEIRTGVSVQMHAPLIARLDGMVEQMRHEMPGMSISRASVVRAVVERWLREQDSAPQPRTRSRST